MDFLELLRKPLLWKNCCRRGVVSSLLNWLSRKVSCFDASAHVLSVSRVEMAQRLQHRMALHRWMFRLADGAEGPSDDGRMTRTSSRAAVWSYMKSSESLSWHSTVDGPPFGWWTAQIHQNRWPGTWRHRLRMVASDDGELATQERASVARGSRPRASAS